MHLERIDLDTSTKSSLHTFLSKEKTPHLLIFSSQDRTFASEVGKAFLLDWLHEEKNSHPDFLELHTSGKGCVHAVDAIRATIKEMYLKPLQGMKRGILIHAGDRMLPASSNALLKVLEEPPSHSVIVLSTDSLDRILPTIRSRSQVLRFPPQKSISSDLVSKMISFFESPRSYEMLSKIAGEIQGILEEKKEKETKRLQSERMRDDFPSTLKNEIEKEIDGMVTIAFQEEVKRFIYELYAYLRGKKGYDLERLIETTEQVLGGIQKGGDLKGLLFWYVAQVVPT